MTDIDGVPRHPLADQFTAPKQNVPGQCMCGAVLPPLREWDDYPHQWAHITCTGCGRGFVDEDDYIAIYDDGLDLDDEEPATNRSADGSCVHGSRDWSCWICWTPLQREEGPGRNEH